LDEPSILGLRSPLVAEYQELEDRQLIQRTALGDKEALEELYTRYSTGVYSLARFMLRQEALAEEATQDIFLNIWLKASSYNPDRGEPRAWIMSVAHHKVVDIIRSRRRNIAVTDPKEYETLDLLPSSQMPTDEEAELNLERERIRKALSSLPPAQREVIILAYYGGYSQSEIAQKLNQPLGTVKTRVRLAMQKLRAQLEQDVSE
jgi:RNA polymerase sigma-70 factor (ECF subfamily)